jgi:hypothetical protein
VPWFACSIVQALQCDYIVCEYSFVEPHRQLEVVTSISLLSYIILHIFNVEKICSHNMNQKLLYPRYRSRKMCCWLIVYMVGKSIARGVVADRKVVTNFMRWRESGGVSFKTFKTEKQKKKIFRLQAPLITSWIREKIWLNAANSAFSKSLHTIVGGHILLYRVVWAKGYHKSFYMIHLSHPHIILHV